MLNYINTLLLASSALSSSFDDGPAAFYECFKLFEWDRAVIVLIQPRPCSDIGCLVINCSHRVNLLLDGLS